MNFELEFFFNISPTRYLKQKVTKQYRPGTDLGFSRGGGGGCSKKFRTFCRPFF